MTLPKNLQELAAIPISEAKYKHVELLYPTILELLDNKSDELLGLTVINIDRVIEIAKECNITPKGIPEDLFAEHWRALAAWNLVRPVVAFDPDFYRDLVKTETSGAVMHIDQLVQICGVPTFFACRASEDEKRALECVDPELASMLLDRVGILINLIPLIDSNKCVHAVVISSIFYTEQGAMLVPAWVQTPNEEITFDNLFAAFHKNYLSNYGENVVKMFCSTVFNCLMAYTSEIPEAAAARVQTIPLNRKRSRLDCRLMSAERCRVIVIGRQYGNEIREWRARERATTPDERRTVRPHIRRAHWARYWVGPRKAENRRQITVWIMPIFVRSTKPAEGATK